MVLISRAWKHGAMAEVLLPYFKLMPSLQKTWKISSVLVGIHEHSTFVAELLDCKENTCVEDDGFNG